MNMTQISASGIHELRQKMQAALDAVGKEYGIQIRMGGIRYTATDFRFKGEGKIVGEAAGDAEAIAKMDWERKCHMYGLLPSLFNKPITINGSIFILRGFKSGHTKYPVLARKYDGKMYKLPLDRVHAAVKHLSTFSVTPITR